MAGRDLQDDDWVGTTVAGAVLHVHPRTVRRYALEGKLPYMATLGGRIRIRVSDLRLIHDEVMPAHDERFQELLTAPGHRPRREGPRDAADHVRPQAAAGRILQRVDWQADPQRTGSLASSGPGWRANIDPAAEGFLATITLHDGTQLRWPPDPTSRPRDLDPCKRWVRRTLMVLVRPATIVARRHETPLLPPQL